MDDNEKAIELLKSLGIAEDVRIISAHLACDIEYGIETYKVFTLDISLSVTHSGLKKVMPVIKQNALAYGMQIGAIDDYIGIDATFKRASLVEDQSVYGFGALPDGR